MDRARLSRQVRAVLVRHGLDDVTLRDLRLDWEARQSAELLRVARQEGGSVTRARAAEVLSVPPTEAYQRLRRLVGRGQLVSVGERYYLPSAVVPPARQREVVLEYLAREGFAYRQDIARVLGLPPAQCRPILQKMLSAGQIKLQKQQYTLNK